MEYRADFKLVDRLLTEKYKFQRISFAESWIKKPAVVERNGVIMPFPDDLKTSAAMTEEEVHSDNVACYWCDDPEEFKKHADMSQPDVVLPTEQLIVLGLDESGEKVIEIYADWYVAAYEINQDLIRIGESSLFDEYHLKEKYKGAIKWE